jgi:hypothetical protein
VIPHLATLLAKPFLKAIPVKPEVKDKFKSLAKILTGGSGEAWIAIARQQVTLPFAEASEAQSSLPTRGEALLDGKPVAWVEFDWPEECNLADCRVRDVRWRFYRNGLVSLAAELSKEGAGLDMSDLLGHQIALRDKTGFLIGIWAAAFVVPKHTKKRAFQASALDDHLPLKLHFDELDAAQTGTWFRI